eukprot:5477358-Prymnesium_polylepis.1
MRHAHKMLVAATQVNAPFRDECLSGNNSRYQFWCVHSKADWRSEATSAGAGPIGDALDRAINLSRLVLANANPIDVVR